MSPFIWCQATVAMNSSEIAQRCLARSPKAERTEVSRSLRRRRSGIRPSRPGLHSVGREWLLGSVPADRAWLNAANGRRSHGLSSKVSRQGEGDRFNDRNHRFIPRRTTVPQRSSFHTRPTACKAVCAGSIPTQCLPQSPCRAGTKTRAIDSAIALASWSITACCWTLRSAVTLCSTPRTASRISARI